MTTPTRATRTAAVPEAVAWLLGGYGGRCGCTGQCGRHHEQGRCNADKFAALTVAPADLVIPLEQAATLPADQLIVWCHRCRDLAETVSRRQLRDQAERELAAAQLGLWGAA